MQWSWKVLQDASGWAREILRSCSFSKRWTRKRVDLKCSHSVPLSIEHHDNQHLQSAKFLLLFHPLHQRKHHCHNWNIGSRKIWKITGKLTKHLSHLILDGMNLGRHRMFPKYFRPKLEPSSGKRIRLVQIKDRIGRHEVSVVSNQKRKEIQVKKRQVRLQHKRICFERWDNHQTQQLKDLGSTISGRWTLWMGRDRRTFGTLNCRLSSDRTKGLRERWTCLLKLFRLLANSSSSFPERENDICLWEISTLCVIMGYQTNLYAKYWWAPLVV